MVEIYQVENVVPDLNRARGTHVNLERKCTLPTHANVVKNSNGNRRRGAKCMSTVSCSKRRCHTTLAPAEGVNRVQPLVLFSTKSDHMLVDPKALGMFGRNRR